MIICSETFFPCTTAGFILEDNKGVVVGGWKFPSLWSLCSIEVVDEKSVETYTSLMLNAGSILHVHGKNKEAIDLYEKALKKANLYHLENQEAASERFYNENQRRRYVECHGIESNSMY